MTRVVIGAVGLVILHLLLLHEAGSSSGLGLDSRNDGTRFTLSSARLGLVDCGDLICCVLSTRDYQGIVQKGHE